MLAQSGVRYVIVLESINDIGRLAHVQVPWDDITAPQLERGLKQIVDAAHEHGIKVIGATLTPYGGANYYSDKGEQVREAVNDWIRSSGTFDGVVDFDKSTRIRRIPRTSIRPTTPAITCTPTTPATRRWATASTSRPSANERYPGRLWLVLCRSRLRAAPAASVYPFCARSMFSAAAGD